MAWDFWDKRKNYSTTNNRLQKEYRSPFTGALEASRLGEENTRRKFDNKACNGSGDCGSGYSCIDGQCVKIYTRDGGNYKPATCGDENVTWAPCKKGNNTGGSKDKCGKPTPGNCEKDPVCPGKKCCRQQRDGSIRCVCGPCSQTDASRCNVWCDANYKNYGDVAAGCFTSDMDGFGECGGNICSECEFCENDFFGAGGICTKGSQGDPFNPLACHCFDSCAGDCEACDRNPGSSTFGECVEDKTNCQQCCTQYNYDCPQCARIVPQATLCQSAASPKPCITALREKLYKQCAEDCATEPDPCAPTGSGSNCVPGNVGGSEPQFTCPEGKTCDYTGYIEVGGENPQTCFLYNTWVTADIPAQCKECDCNCHNDCRDCELCGADGKCYDDPLCTSDSLELIATVSYNVTVSGVCFSSYSCVLDLAQSTEHVLSSPISAIEAAKYGIEYETGATSGISICTECQLANDGIQYFCKAGAYRPCAVPTKTAYITYNGVRTGSSYRLEGCRYSGTCNNNPGYPEERTGGTIVLSVRSV